MPVGSSTEMAQRIFIHRDLHSFSSSSVKKHKKNIVFVTVIVHVIQIYQINYKLQSKWQTFCRQIKTRNNGYGAPKKLQVRHIRGNQRKLQS